MSQIPPPPPPGYPPQPPMGYPPRPPMGYPPVGMGQYAPPPPARGNGAAVGSLICGLLGCLPYITGVFAVILGIVGIRKTRRPGVGGRGMAIAGLVLGLISIIGWIIISAAGGAIWAAYVYSTPARAEALAFAKELSTGQVDAAMARCTNAVTRAQLDAASEKLMAVGPIRDTVMPVFSYQATNGTETVVLSGAAQFTGQNATGYNVHLIKVNGVFKIDSFLFMNQNAGGGANVPASPPLPSPTSAPGAPNADASDPPAPDAPQTATPAGSP